MNVCRMMSRNRFFFLWVRSFFGVEEQRSKGAGMGSRGGGIGIRLVY